MNARDNLRAILWAKGPHSPDRSAWVTGLIEAYRAEVLSEAADLVDAMLTAEPDNMRASALYEALLQLRGLLPCTCARSQGLHEKKCRRYVAGHELLSPVNALATYRAAQTKDPGQAGKDTPTGESTQPPLGEFVSCAFGCSGEWEGRALERGWTATPAGLICPQHDAQPAELLALATQFEIPRPGNALPLLLMRSYAGGDRWAICDREGRCWHREHGFVYEAQAISEADRTDTRFPLAEALPLARQLACDAERGEAG